MFNLKGRYAVLEKSPETLYFLRPGRFPYMYRINPKNFPKPLIPEIIVP
jgi:hypothetical protein